MPNILHLFSVNFVLITILNYPLSLVELLGTAFGLWSVILAAREKISNYPVGLINILFFFILFYQVQLYPDMFLQIYFFIISFYGWWKWLHPEENEAKSKNELKITAYSLKTNLIIVLVILAGVGVFGTLMKNLNILLPAFFKYPAAFPYYDSFVAVASVVAEFLLAKKKLENWAIWVAVDLFCVVLYFIRGIKLMSIEYFIFLVIAIFGLLRWNREYKAGIAKSVSDKVG
jgi:nicotinamide mononucleotide transporter